jgi:hypothetical protein
VRLLLLIKRLLLRRRASVPQYFRVQQEIIFLCLRLSLLQAVSLLLAFRLLHRSSRKPLLRLRRPLLQLTQVARSLYPFLKLPTEARPLILLSS